jgi:hypothetical protein
LLTGSGTEQDVRDIHDTIPWVEDGHRCYLPTSEALVMAGILQKFPEAFAARVRGNCTKRHNLPAPKMVDYDAHGGFTYDPPYLHKQPDWTYDDEPRLRPVDEGALPSLR